MIAEPFPHLVLKGLWSNGELARIAAEFPEQSDPRWRTYPDPREIGKKAGAEPMWGPATQEWFRWIRTGAFCEQMTRWTGIQPLVADTLGGGMHCTGEGGRLAMHTDFSLHPSMPDMVRRVNMLTFLNPEWDKDWGGVLYLGAKREVEVLPLMNTTVIFETSATSWHGHPDPIVGPHLRKSVAAYFYAPRRPEDTIRETTVWQEER